MGKKNKSKKQNPSTTGGSDKGSGNQNTGRVIADSRFSKVHSDPRFQKLPRHKTKVSIDSRFSGLFTDKRFSTSTARQDKRGKQKKNFWESDLRWYYRLKEEEENRKGREEVKEERTIEKSAVKENGMESEWSIGGISSDSGPEDESEILKLNNDDEDEEGEEEDSDEEGGTESDSTASTINTDEDDDVTLDEDASVEVENVPIIEKETHRLAVVNMDWSHVKASDLFVLLSSFLPKGGQILSVTVYPSEFGLKRMEEETVHGPVALFDDKKEGDEEDSDDDEIDNEKLRAYEKSRLRYYYGVVECDSVATADYLYKASDGLEFERSSNVLDLRFIPDEMEFKHRPRDRATEAPSNYEGLDFHTWALQHSDMMLSWDEDEPHRVKTLKHKFNADQLADLELKEFLASDESESEEDDEKGDAEEYLSKKKSMKHDMYRALIQSGDGSGGEEGEEDEGQEMEVTFNTGLEDISKKILEKKDKKSETVWEKYLRERKERKKAKKNRSKDSSDDESNDSDEAPIEEPDDFFEEEPQVKKTKKGTDLGKKMKKKKREIKIIETDKEAEVSRAELELLLADDKGENDKIKGYKIKHAKGKGKKKSKEAPGEDKLPNIDHDDPRFYALGSNPLFALDPTDPHFKRSTTYARQLARQQRKTQEDLIEEEERMKLPKQNGLTSNDSNKGEDEPSKGNHEMALSVKSLKMKLKQAAFPATKRGKEELNFSGSLNGKRRKA